MSEGTLALLIQVDTSPNPWREPRIEITCEVVRWLHAEDETRSVDSYEQAGLDHLQLRAAGGKYSNEPRRMYGDYHLEYKNCYSLSTRDVQAMAKVVGKAERHYAKHCEKYGYPATFGAYVAIMSEALGITCVLDAKARGDMWVSGRRHRTMNPGEAISCIDSKARAWVQEEETVTA